MIPKSPLGNWTAQEIDWSCTFGLTELLSKGENGVSEVSFIGDGVNVDDPELDDLDVADDVEVDDASVLLEHLTNLHFDSPRPIRTDEEVALFMELYGNMRAPVSLGGRKNIIDWDLLTNQFNA